MKRSAWKWAGILTAAGLAGSAWAQGPGGSAPVVLQSPCQTPAAMSGASTSPQTPQAPSAVPTPSQPGEMGAQGNMPAEAGPATGGEGFAASNSYFGGGSAAAGAGGAAATGIGAGQPTNIVPQPLVLPGLLTAANAEPARPLDRVFLSYTYYDHFKVVQTFFDPATGNPTGSARVTGFNLNRFDVGAEKTFFDGAASVYVRAPYLDATQNVFGLPLDGAGDISGGLKVVLLHDCDSGSALTAGLTVSAPTARDAILTTGIDRSNPAAPRFTTTKINPTFIQPWTAGLLALDRLFVQDYLGVIVPTEDKVSTFINNDLTIGYQIYRGDCEQLLRFVAPTVDVQALIPVNHEGSGGAIVPVRPGAGGAIAIGSPTFPNQVFVTGGVQVGLGERVILSGGVVVPVVGPKAFDVGFTGGINILY